MPRISVIIPVYNGERFLARTLDSLLAQSYGDFEVVVVDDGSSDRSGEILRRYAEADPRVRIHAKPNGGNAGRAVAFGLERAAGEWMMYSSQDDLYSPDLLEKNMEAVSEHRAQAAVPAMVFWFGSDDMRPARNEIDGVISGREAFLLSLDWRITGFTMWSMDVVRRVGWRDEWINADEFTTRMLYINCDRVASSRGIFYYFQGNENAITKRWRPQLLESFITTDRIEQYMKEGDFTEDEIMINRINYVNETVRILSIFLRSSDAADPVARKRGLATIRRVYDNYRGKIVSAEGVPLAKRICLADWHLLLASMSIVNALHQNG